MVWKYHNLHISTGRRNRLFPITGELTYGLERLAMYIQGVDSVYDLAWNSEGIK